MSALNSFSLLLVASAAITTVLALIALQRMRAWLPVDQPNARSLHAVPILRIGGLGILIGAGPVILYSLMVGDRAGMSLPVIFSCALVLLLISLVDDFRHLPVLWRLGFQGLSAGLVAGLFSLPWLYALGAALLLVWMTNLYNFMDGADGLAGTMALIGFSSYAMTAWSTAPDLAIACAIIAASAAGFLVFNIPPAKIFMGDAGSIPLGFLAGAFGLVGWETGVWPVEYPFLVFFPFIADSSLTLVRRLLKGEAVWRAHNNHCYQRLVRMGWRHGSVLALYGSLMVAAMLATNLKVGFDNGEFKGLLGCFALVFLCIFVWVELKWRSHTSGHSSSRIP